MKATIDLAPYPSPPVELVSAFRAPRDGEQVMPPPPLHTPVHHPSDPPHLDLFDRVRPRLDTRQKQNRLLNFRSQVGQPHDVRHAGGSDVGFGIGRRMSKFESFSVSVRPEATPSP